MRIVALGAVGAEFVHEFFLHAAMLFDFFVGHLDCLEHICLGDFFHLAFHHHDVFFGGCDHEFDVGIGKLAEVRVDNPFTIYTAHANLGDRASERTVAGCEGAGSGKTCKGIGLHVLLCRYQVYIYEYFIVKIRRPQRADGAVHEASYKHLIVRRFAFPFQEASGETPCGVIFLAIVN